MVSTHHKLVGSLHGELVHSRRVNVLASHLAPLLPPGAQVVDVGCGDGQLARLIQEQRPDCSLSGYDVLVREHTQVPVQAFDGQRLPLADGSVDVVMFVDVLHHTVDPLVLLAEARRVARQAVVFKDHTRDGLLAGPTLRFMDWVGNAPHGVALPYNYWPERRWKQAFEQLGLAVDHWESRLGLYPAPASWLFERKLHFVARLIPQQAA